MLQSPETVINAMLACVICRWCLWYFSAYKIAASSGPSVWLSRSKAKRAAMQRLMLATAALGNSQLHRCWASWLDYTISNLAVKQRLTMAMAALSHGLLHRSWVSWLTFRQIRLAAKAKMMAAVSHWRGHISSLCFWCWTAQASVAKDAALRGGELSHRISNVLRVSHYHIADIWHNKCGPVSMSVGNEGTKVLICWRKEEAKA